MAALVIIAQTIALAALTYWLFAKRVHIHITYQDSGSGSRHHSGETGARRVKRAPVKISNEGEPEVRSALVNLGCQKTKARDIAARVCASGPADFDDRLRRAIQEAA